MRQAWWRERCAWDTAGSSGWPKLGRGGGVRGGGALSSALREPLSVSRAEGAAVMGATPQGRH